MSNALKRYLAFAFAGADLLFEVGSDGRIGFVLGAGSTVSERSDAELAGRPWSELFDPADVPFVEAMLQSLEAGGRCGPVSVGLRPLGGKSHQGVFSACRLPGGDGIACTLSQATLSTSERALQERRDTESHLLKPEAFADRAAALMQSAPALGEELGMTLLEIPGLSALKAGIDGAKGAQLIAGIGAALRMASVGGNAVGRLGDDRFGLVHDSRLDGSALDSRLEEITRKADPAGRGTAVQRSALPMIQGDLSAEDAMKAIRYVVNTFAAEGANAATPASLTTAFSTLVAETVARVQRFSSMVDSDSFRLVYQPIVMLSDRQVHHYEVLARFEGSASPFQEIQFAEAIGVIERFDLAVCARVLAGMAEGTYGPAQLAVNVSGRSIQNGLFVRSLLGLLEQHRKQAGNLLFEITESSELTDLAAVDAIVQRIRKHGAKVCLDDFGAGAASFQYLHGLNIDHVKIDGAYVKRLGQSKRDDALLRGLVRLCDDLGVGTIAEMVETEAQADQLRAMGVRFGQGWLFGKPVDTVPKPAQSAFWPSQTTRKRA